MHRIKELQRKVENKNESVLPHTKKNKIKKFRPRVVISIILL